MATAQELQDKLARAEERIKELTAFANAVAKAAQLSFDLPHEAAFIVTWDDDLADAGEPHITAGMIRRAQGNL